MAYLDDHSPARSQFRYPRHLEHRRPSMADTDAPDYPIPDPDAHGLIPPGETPPEETNDGDR